MKLPLSLHLGVSSVYLRDAERRYVAKGVGTDTEAHGDMHDLCILANESAKLAELLTQALEHVECTANTCEVNRYRIEAEVLSDRIRNALVAPTVRAAVAVGAI